jgi:hypothetical protein
MYKILDPKTTTELSLIRHGWFSPDYELTDGAESYGRLSYSMLSRRVATAVSATSTWTFAFKQLFSRTILIIDQNGAVIGEASRELFSRTRILNMQSGFRAEFYRPVIFSWNYIWVSEGYGQIMNIKMYPFTLKSVVTINQSMAPPALIPMLIFFGQHLTILRRRRKGAR